MHHLIYLFSIYFCLNINITDYIYIYIILCDYADMKEYLWVLFWLKLKNKVYPSACLIKYV